MKCFRCGSTFESINDFCPICGSIIQSRIDNTDSRKNVPWETVNASKYPLFAFFNTINESFFNTDIFFTKLKDSITSNNSAWLFGLISGSFGMLSLFLWSAFIPDFSAETEKNISESAMGLMLTPVILSVQMFLLTFYVHFMLIVTRSKKAPVKATFKICCYSLGALILNAIPVAGPLISPLFLFYLILTGLQYVHQMSKWKAAVILIFPIVLFMMIFTVLLAIIIGSIFVGSFSNQLF